MEATDGRIGAVDRASEDAGAGYLMVDTGPWIFDRKVLLPVKESPAFDPDDFDRPEYREQVGDYYAESYRRG
ncbi:hypothetical protein [Micromonospora terminaliae]|uniref:hypothetical protein n=1 Tax=Micromonospora terminaliae TaxID=1914461 RepID=UPI001EF895A9|nr:hypothetical protein [Micromonospora terminaliae]